MKRCDTRHLAAAPARPALKAHGDAVAYRDFRDRYRDMAKCWLPGHIAWAKAMIKVENRLATTNSQFASGMKTAPGGSPGAVSTSSGDRIRTCDLWVMSPASYRAAPPRDG